MEKIEIPNEKLSSNKPRSGAFAITVLFKEGKSWHQLLYTIYPVIGTTDVGWSGHQHRLVSTEFGSIPRYAVILMSLQIYPSACIYMIYIYTYIYMIHSLKLTWPLKYRPSQKETIVLQNSKPSHFQVLPSYWYWRLWPGESSIKQVSLYHYC